MQEEKGILDIAKQHDKLRIKVGSNENHFVPAEILPKAIQPHRLTFYFFVFIDSGSLTYRVDLQDFTISDGHLLFALPNQIFKPPSKTGKLEYYKLGFDENTLALLPQQFPFLVNPLNKQTINFDDAAKLRVKKVFEILNQILYTNKQQTDTEIILAHLNTLLTELNNAYFKSTQQGNISNPKLSKYIEFKLVVEKTLTEQHSINTIAEKLALTSNSLYGIVKEFAGISPKEFIINRLMTEAQRKLHYSKISVKELAYELGFNDPDYFSRLFKKSTGQSVSEFLANQQDLSGK